MKKQIKKQIKEILDNFDFEKVSKTMKLLGWEWYSVGVPSVEDLKEQSTYMLKKAYKLNTSIATGGLEAYYNKKDNYFQLKFIIESFDTYIDL